MRLYEPYLVQWPGLSQRPSPARTNLKMREPKSVNVIIIVTNVLIEETLWMSKLRMC